MPLISRVFIFTSFVYLTVYLALPLIVEITALPAAARLSVMSVHLFNLGFLTQVIIGVAWWMFPRSGKAWSRKTGERIAWIIFIMLNTGLVLRHAGYAAGTVTGTQLGWAGSLQFTALVLFAILMWNRVRPASTRKR